MQQNDKKVRFRVFISPPKPYESQDRLRVLQVVEQRFQSGFRFQQRNLMVAAPKCPGQFNKDIQ